MMQPGRSPLWMVMGDPVIEAFVHQVERAVREVQDGATHAELVVTQAEVAEVREAFAARIRDVEARLHRLCALLWDFWVGAPADLRSVVVARLPGTDERLTLEQALTAHELAQQTDVDLGNRLLDRSRYLVDDQWVRAELVANYVEYHPRGVNRQGVHKLISRIKAEEEIWNKVADRIFDIDARVARDKQLSELGRYVRDIFGLKAVVASVEDARRVHAAIYEARWSDAELVAHDVPVGAGDRLQILETKDYLGDGKASGWEAVKSVVQWWDATFELQVQPLQNYLMERDRLSGQSHAAFRDRREAAREQMAVQVPLYGEVRAVLRSLFVAPHAMDTTTGALRVRYRG